MTEFLTAQTVPAGVYTEMTMTLDYTDADIQVEDDAGNAVAADAIVDEDGNTVTTLTLDVTFSDTDRLVVAPGIPAHMTLDFDLASSNQVEFNAGSPTVTVSPTLSAEINSGIDVGAVIKLRGFFTPAGTGDFDATTIINVTKARATLMATWRPVSDTAFTIVDETGIALDLTGVGHFHHVNRGWIIFDDASATMAADVIEVHLQ